MSTKVFYDLRSMNNKVKFNCYIVSVVYLYYLEYDFDFYYFLFFKVITLPSNEVNPCLIPSLPSTWCHYYLFLLLLLLFCTIFINFLVKNVLYRITQSCLHYLHLHRPMQVNPCHHYLVLRTVPLLILLLLLLLYCTFFY